MINRVARGVVGGVDSIKGGVAGGVRCSKCLRFRVAGVDKSYTSSEFAVKCNK